MNPYIPLKGKVRSARFESNDRSLKTIDIVIEGKDDHITGKFIPGQFCEVGIIGKGEGPFGIASSPYEDFLRFTINKTGYLTTYLHHLEEGDIVYIRGPYGNGYPVHLLENKNIVIVSGGFAFTTLRSLTLFLLKERGKYGDITLIYGARRPDLLIYREELEEWSKRGDINVYLTIDTPQEGWNGYVGFVPNVLKEVSPKPDNAHLVMCGPPAMIKFTIPVINELGFEPKNVWTSLERRMKCGIGKCGRCNIGKYYVCKDGPVFSLEELKSLPKEY